MQLSPDAEQRPDADPSTCRPKRDDRNIEITEPGTDRAFPDHRDDRRFESRSIQSLHESEQGHFRPAGLKVVDDVGDADHADTA